MRNLISWLPAVGIAATLCIDSPVFAQAEAPAPAPIEDNDIIVTAQKRSESVREVPATLLVRDAEDLAKIGVRQPSDLTIAFPGLTFSVLATAAQPSIRGVTSDATLSNSEQPVAIYIDGIYQPNQTSNSSFDTTNVAGIDVLKGPQGTVFGRNVVGGAILVRTKDPELNRFTGQLSATASFYSGGTARTSFSNEQQFFLSAPLIEDRLAASIAASRMVNQGWLTDLTPGGNGRTGRWRNYSIQGKVLWQPTDAVRLLLSARYVDQNKEFAGTVAKGVSLTQLFPDGVIGTRPWEVAHDSDAHIHAKSQTYSLRADIDTGQGTLTSLTAYQRFLPTAINDTDGGYSPQCRAAGYCIDLRFNQQAPEVISQEFDFASKKFGRFSFLAGVYAFSMDSKTFVYLDENTFYADVRDNTKSIAGFGEGTFELTDRLSAIAGLRYTHDTATQKGTNVLGAPFSPKNTHSWNAVTSRLGLKYRPTDQLNLYATFSQGFKSGLLTTPTFNTVVDGDVVNLTPSEPVDPEHLEAWEAGAKLSLPGVNLNVSAFKYDYKDLQVQIFQGVQVVTSNAAKVKMLGVDADGSIRMMAGLRLSGGFSWLPKSKYASFPDAQVYEATPPTASQVTRDLSGKRTIRAPKLTLSSALDYDFDAFGGSFNLNANVYHSSSYSTDYGSNIVQPGYNIFGASASFSPGNGPTTLTLYGRNLGNKAYITSSLLSPSGFLVNYAPPREIGLTAAYRF